MLTKSDDPTHKQKAIYSLTEKGIALLPIIIQIGAWGSCWIKDAKKLDARARKVLREIRRKGPVDGRNEWTRCEHSTRAREPRPSQLLFEEGSRMFRRMVVMGLVAMGATAWAAESSPPLSKPQGPSPSRSGHLPTTV